MNLDNYIEGDYDSANPANQEPIKMTFEDVINDIPRAYKSIIIDKIDELEFIISQLQKKIK